MIDDQPKLKGSGVVVTLVCEYMRDPEGALSSIDARSDHNHLPRQLSTAFPCHRCDKCGKVFTQPGNRTRDLLQSRQVL